MKSARFNPNVVVQQARDRNTTGSEVDDEQVKANSEYHEPRYPLFYYYYYYCSFSDAFYLLWSIIDRWISWMDGNVKKTSGCIWISIGSVSFGALDVVCKPFCSLFGRSNTWIDFHKRKCEEIKRTHQNFCLGTLLVIDWGIDEISGKASSETYVLKCLNKYGFRSGFCFSILTENCRY